MGQIKSNQNQDYMDLILHFFFFGPITVTFGLNGSCCLDETKEVEALLMNDLKHSHHGYESLNPFRIRFFYYFSFLFCPILINLYTHNFLFWLSEAIGLKTKMTFDDAKYDNAHVPSLVLCKMTGHHGIMVGLF